MDSSLSRYLLCLLGVLTALPAVVLTFLVFVTPISASGAVYLLGYWLVIIGLLTAPWQPRIHLGLLVGGILVIMVTAGARLSFLRNQNPGARVIILPSANETRWVNWLIDEQDSVLFGEEMMYRLGGVSGREHERLTPALAAAYASARAGNGAGASPFLSTYLGLQRAAAFDAVVIEPADNPPSPIGVVFLHGYMGNVGIQCWQIAEAAGKVGAVTVCPSTSWIGDWWTPDGQDIIQAAFSYLRERGIQRIYLGGYSNGGVGVGSLAPVLASEPELRGLFFIAGVRNGAGVRDANLPVLVIQGRGDERMPAEAARLFVSEVGDLATYVELDADHFLIMKQPQLVQTALAVWLEDQERADKLLSEQIH